MFDQSTTVAVSSLQAMEPGPALAAALAAIDRAELSAHDRVDVLIAHQRQVAHYTARSCEDMVAIERHMLDSGDEPQAAFENAGAEIRVALRLTRRAADSRLAFATDLCHRLPDVGDRLRRGDIDERRARILVEGTAHLPAVEARAVAAQLLDEAGDLTTGQLAAKLRRLCIEVDPDAAVHRYENAVEQRRVASGMTDQGTANLYALDAPPHRVAAITRRINRLARSLRRNGDLRTMDQLRADVLLDILAGRPATADHGSRSGGVQLHVDLATLMRLNESAADLAGFGPVIADIARQVADEQLNSQWRFTVADPVTGEPIHVGTTRRRPRAGERRMVEARAQACVFPGCRMAALDCDLDHVAPYGEGGATNADNLEPLCRHDHRIRHQAHWSHRRLPSGAHEWTTKLGRTYVASGTPP